MAFLITRVHIGSAAQKAGITPGLRLFKINGEKINDVLDYRFYTADKDLFVELIDKHENIITKHVKKPQYQDLGLVFESYLMDKPKKCANNCIFCFIDQLPKGMREPLYFKDDDTRLSFLTGNYVTLTNVSDADIDRIIKQRISPINISVHSTDPKVREMMIRNKNAKKVLGYMQRLCLAKIPMNGQLVICKGINDGEILKKSMEDLRKFAPALKSVSIVPAGVTKFRENLYPITPFDNSDAGEVLDLVLETGDACLKSFGTRLFYPSDEFFVLAKRQMPDAGFYEDFLQLENGVGMMSLFKDEFYDALNDCKKDDIRCDEFSIITGEAAHSFICSLVDEVRKKCHNLNANIYKIENNFFGKTVTVSGLLTGRDLICQLEAKSLGSEAYFPCSMLKSGTNIFLDDLTKLDLENKFGIKFNDIQNSGYDFFNIFLKRRQEQTSFLKNTLEG